MTRAELREIVFNYVMEDNHRLEIITDIEICSAKDMDKAELELDKVLSNMSTEELKDIVERINHDDDYGSYYEIFFGD